MSVDAVWVLTFVVVCAFGIARMLWHVRPTGPAPEVLQGAAEWAKRLAQHVGMNLMFFAMAIMACLVVVQGPYEMASNLLGYMPQQKIDRKLQKVEARLAAVQGDLSAPLPEATSNRAAVRHFERKVELEKEVATLEKKKRRLEKFKPTAPWIDDAATYLTMFFPAALYVGFRLSGYLYRNKRVSRVAPRPNG